MSLWEDDHGNFLIEDVKSKKDVSRFYCTYCSKGRNESQEVFFDYEQRLLIVLYDMLTIHRRSTRPVVSTEAEFSMKKLLAVLFAVPAFLFLPGSSSAVAEGWQLGVKGAVSFSDFGFTPDQINPYFPQHSGSYVGGFSTEKSFNGGLVALKRISEAGKLNFSVEFKSLRTTTHVFGPSDGVHEIHLKFDYIVATLKLQINSQSGFFVNAGPSFGFNTIAGIKWEGDREFHSSSNGSSVRFAVALGAGIELPAGPFTCIPQASYDFGLSDTYEGESENLLRASSYDVGVAIVLNS